VSNSKILVMVLVGALIGGVLVYAALSGQLHLYQQQLAQTQQALQQAQQVVTPLDLTLTKGNGTYNLSAYVAADGSTTAATVQDTLTVTNNDNESGTIIITLKNPKTSEDGLPSALENTYFNVWIGSLSLQKYMFKDGDYTSGAKLTIDGDSVVNLYIGVELEQAPAGTFTDNQTYTMELYVYQPASGYVETLTYTITT